MADETHDDAAHEGADRTDDRTDDQTEDQRGSQPGERPPLRLVRGDASPEEVAALLAVLSAASAGEPEAPTRHTSQWSSPARAVRRPIAPGAGAWRASAWPR
jgi:hypothetical protein